jgi:hypothetical protein
MYSLVNQRSSSLDSKVVFLLRSWKRGTVQCQGSTASFARIIFLEYNQKNEPQWKRPPYWWRIWFYDGWWSVIRPIDVEMCYAGKQPLVSHLEFIKLSVSLVVRIERDARHLSNDISFFFNTTTAWFWRWFAYLASFLRWKGHISKSLSSWTQHKRKIGILSRVIGIICTIQALTTPCVMKSVVTALSIIYER